MAASVYTPVFTLVPADFFDRENARAMLSEVSPVDGDAKVGYLEVPRYNAVLVYSAGTGDDEQGYPEIYNILNSLDNCPEYNKILCSYSSGYLFLAIAQGRNLLLANSFHAPDFTTAEYYIFRALKELQLNPEVSVICWRTPVSPEDEMSLYRYFKDVVVF